MSTKKLAAQVTSFAFHHGISRHSAWAMTLGKHKDYANSVNPYTYPGKKVTDPKTMSWSDLLHDDMTHTCPNCESLKKYHLTSKKMTEEILNLKQHLAGHWGDAGIEGASGAKQETQKHLKAPLFSWVETTPKSVTAEWGGPKNISNLLAGPENTLSSIAMNEQIISAPVAQALPPIAKNSQVISVAPGDQVLIQATYEANIQVPKGWSVVVVKK